MTASSKSLRPLRADRLARLFAPAVVDVFAGLGGWSIGAERAFVEGGYRDRYIDLMINHWDIAVAVHQVNHPLTHHLHADVREVDPAFVLRGRKIAYAHFSPDCTDHSKAKGGKPRRKEIRALADVVIIWARSRRPTVITLENVEEFRQWGPLLADGMPDKSRRGEEFARWVGELRALGYAVDWRELRACDYGAPTTRKRLFVVARCDGREIVWPERTHGNAKSHDRKSRVAMEGIGTKRPAHPGRDGQGHGDGNDLRSADASCEILHRRALDRRLPFTKALKPYRTAAECIDWSIPMLSIFATPDKAKAWARALNACREKLERIGTPRRPLKPKTLARIARGLDKFVLKAKRPFIVDIQNYGWNSTAVRDIDAPMPTVAAGPRGGGFAAVDVGLAPYTVPNLGERPSTPAKSGQAPRCGSIEQPMPTVTAKANGARLVAATLQALNRGGEEHRAQSPAEPIRTVPGANDARALVAALITKHFGASDGGTSTPGSSIDAPIDCVTAKDHNALTCAFLQNFHGAKGGEVRCEDPSAPLPTLDTQNRHAVTAAYLSQFYSSSTRGGDGTLDAPAPTVTGGGQHAALVAAFLSTYYGTSKDGAAVAIPMPTVVGKARMSLVTAVIDGQSYIVTDIAMRMLTPRELARAQGFDDSYIIDRTVDGRRISKADQVKLIGNSVPPDVARAIVKANIVDCGLLDEPRAPRGQGRRGRSAAAGGRELLLAEAAR